MALAVGLSACKKDEVSPPEITISTSSVRFQAASGLEKEITFSTNVDWTVSVDYEGETKGWLSIAPEFGKSGENQHITLKAIENPQAVERKARVTITYEDQPHRITVTQEAVNSMFSIDKTAFRLGAEENREAKVTFSTNVEWTASVGYANDPTDWLTVSSTGGGPGEKIELTLTADENTVTIGRSTRVIINYGGIEQTITVSQEKYDRDVTADFDPLFAARLQANGYIPDADKIMLSEVDKIVQINVSSDYIEVEGMLTSLAGIEHFARLEILDCAYNEIKSLDVSNNTQLSKLYCGGNFNLTTLDVSHNTALTELDCHTNQIRSLNVAHNTLLRILNCEWNQLSSLDVRNLSLLEELNCGSNSIRMLDVSENPKLVHLSCYNNLLSSLDVCNLSLLESLRCDENSIRTLDIGENPKLVYLVCSYNRLTSLDVTKNTQLEQLAIWVNEISSLDVSKNTNLSNLQCNNNKLSVLDVSQCPKLTILIASDNRLTSLDISNNRNIEYFLCYNNPGNGISFLPVRAWFDNAHVPAYFTTPSEPWDYNSTRVVVDYQDVVD